MRISTLGYVGKQGVKNIWRNKMFSLASHCDDVSLYLPVWIIFCNYIKFQYIIRTAEEGVAITVFFEEDATDEQKEAIGQSWKS